MQVDFTADQEARLHEIAQHTGTNSEELVKKIALRYLDEEARFREGVRRGIAAADRNDSSNLRTFGPTSNSSFPDAPKMDCTRC